MKKIVISTLAVLMACPAFANGVGESSWQLFGLDPYIGLRGGLAWTNLNYNFNGAKKSIQDLTFQGRAALGLEVCDRVRGEIEYSLSSKAKDNKDFNGIADVKVESNLQTLLFNMYWEMGDCKSFVRSWAWVPVSDLPISNALFPKSAATQTTMYTSRRWAHWA